SETGGGKYPVPLELRLGGSPLRGASAGVVGKHSRSAGPKNSCKLRKYCSRRCTASATRRRSSWFTSSKLAATSEPNSGFALAIHAPNEFLISPHWITQKVPAHVAKLCPAPSGTSSCSDDSRTAPPNVSRSRRIGSDKASWTSVSARAKASRIK